MKIQESTVQLTASHEATRTQTQEITTQQEFRHMFDSLAGVQADDKTAARQKVEKLLQGLIDAILAAMGGKKSDDNVAACDNLPVPAAATSPVSTAEMDWQRTIVKTVSESERTSVCGSGCVQTSDGRSINFDYSLKLARDYTCSQKSSESGTVALRDPLMLSFDGTSAELTEQRLDFDLNADGTAEQIPAAGANSGFLVFDRNGNGKADDGSELFGTRGGNGFSDLAKLDSDHNGWIDEADPAFKQMGIWSGNSFRSLTQSGVGALYTSAVDAPFSLKTGSNELLGQIRSAGLFLSESGVAGSLQQVDLAVSTPQPAAPAT